MRIIPLPKRQEGGPSVAGNQDLSGNGPRVAIPFCMRTLTAFLVLATAPGGSPLSCQAAAQDQSDPPRLVVFIAVDQLRPDYFTRYADQLTGGLKRFYQQGAFYTRGEQDHALTETAPGHATMLTGRSPASVGIVSNTLGVFDPESPIVALDGPGASPRRFRGTTLYDWMKKADGGVRVLSVSRKDRGAILPIGRAKVPVYWYLSGFFTTSTWYADAIPDWLRRWNRRGGAYQFAGMSWDLLLSEDQYDEPDDQPWEYGGRATTFPHQFSRDSLRVVNELISSPWTDSLTLDVALEGVKALEIGRRNRPDLLSISLSSTDAVGHGWGPDSREIHDQILRLDHWLGWFMDSLATVVPSERTLYVLTSDHGVQSFPEQLTSVGRMGGRVVLSGIMLGVNDLLETQHHRSFGLNFDNGLFYGDVTALRKAGVDVDSLASSLASLVANQTGVTGVFTPRTLAAAADDNRSAGMWRRSLPSDFEWLVAANLAPGYLWSYSPFTTTHGTTNAADVLVPIAFMGKGIVAGRYARARTVDIAPTIAALLHIEPLEAVEGEVLKEVVP